MNINQDLCVVPIFFDKDELVVISEQYENVHSMMLNCGVTKKDAKFVHKFCE